MKTLSEKIMSTEQVESETDYVFFYTNEYSKRYYNAEGQLHRESGPAQEYGDGGKCWYLNGKYHREDGPAVECYGIKRWCINGQSHRENGPAVEYSNGIKEYFLNGKRHREDGPAIEWSDGSKSWYLNGEEANEETIKILSEKIIKIIR